MFGAGNVAVWGQVCEDRCAGRGGVWGEWMGQLVMWSSGNAAVKAAASGVT